MRSAKQARERHPAPKDNGHQTEKGRAQKNVADSPPKRQDAHKQGPLKAPAQLKNIARSGAAKSRQQRAFKKAAAAMTKLNNWDYLSGEPLRTLGAPAACLLPGARPPKVCKPLTTRGTSARVIWNKGVYLELNSCTFASIT